MARRAAKIDRNQPEIVKGLRQYGATVTSLAAVGAGCPDLLVGYRGANYLMEVKDGELAPSARALRPTQVEWHGDWRGQVAVVYSLDDAIDVLRSGGQVPLVGIIT